MAIGPTPKYERTFSLNGLTPEQFLVLALEAATGLGWQVRYLSQSGIVAIVRQQAQVMVRIERGKVVVTSSSINTELFDFGKNKKVVTSFIAAFESLTPNLSQEYLAARFEALLPFLPPPEADAFVQTRPKARSTLGDVWAIFKPVQGYFITPIILNLNLLVFLLMSLSGVSMLQPDSVSLIQWGANLGERTVAGEWWRLLTACFVHIGAFHLFMNMYALLLIGAQLEPRLGTKRFLAAYFITGAMASLASLFWHSYTISAGASGAIFGMYGVFLALLTTSLVEKANRRQLLASILFFVIYNLLNGLKPGIDNAAHIGGLLSGLLIGYGFVPRLRKIAFQQAPTSEPTFAQNESGDYY